MCGAIGVIAAALRNSRLQQLWRCRVTAPAWFPSTNTWHRCWRAPCRSLKPTYVDRCVVGQEGFLPTPGLRMCDVARASAAGVPLATSDPRSSATLERLPEHPDTSGGGHRRE